MKLNELMKIQKRYNAIEKTNYLSAKKIIRLISRKRIAKN